MSFFDTELYNFLVNEKNCEEKVVRSICELNRRHFLPENQQNLIQTYKPIPIGYGQTMSAPFIVASMTDLLDVEPHQKILEIGSGCGYQTAVLIGMGTDVYSIEYISELADFGRSNLEKIGLKVNLRCGDGYFGWPDEAPFDRIIIAATLPKVPIKLISQLRVGGKMVFPLKKENREFMVRLHKTSELDHSIEWLYGVIFVPFVGEILK
jgi:protein-L-isoaspartate(D-aspartate) O-methyltransferase